MESMDCLWTPWTSKGFGIEHKIYRNFFGLHGYLVDSVDSSTSRTFHSPTDSCRNPAGIQEFCRNDQIPWIPGGFRPESSRNSCYFRNISTFGGTYIYLYSYLTYKSGGVRWLEI